jgi:pimeloyl-ACP methyl ester carboxylesterase
MSALSDSLEAFPRIDVEANGIRFAIRTAGEGDKLALCLHGFPEAWFSWRHQMPLLAKLGYRVWAPDLRGYGDTDRPRRVKDYATDRLVEDVGALVDASGSKDVTLISHDWGGMVGWHYAMKESARRADGTRQSARPPLSRFVAMNIPHPRLFQEALRKPFGPQLLRSWYIFLFQLPRVPEWYLARHDYRAIRGAFRSMAVDKSRFPKELLDLYARSASSPGALSAMVAYYRAALRYPPTGGFPKIEAPTLLVWGEEDTALGKELTYGTDRYVSDLTTRYVPDCSHWVQQEKPDEVNAILESWLTTSR